MLTNGQTTANVNWVHEWSGAGAWCEPSGVVVSNCVFINDYAYGQAGGIYGGTPINCVFTNNYGYSGGGAMNSALIIARLRTT